jgi:pimeloyl-ACP methyl ester carboxylesterase
VERVLPPGSRAETVEHAGHFMQLDRPDDVARRIVDFIGRAEG